MIHQRVVGSIVVVAFLLSAGCAVDRITQAPQSIYINPQVGGTETAGLKGATDAIATQFGLIGGLVAASADLASDANPKVKRFAAATKDHREILVKCLTHALKERGVRLVNRPQDAELQVNLGSSLVFSSTPVQRDLMPSATIYIAALDINQQTVLKKTENVAPPPGPLR
jgi:hypothetical protein